MARMFPARLLGHTTSAAERRLYTRFERDLGSKFVVFHSVAWLAQSGDGRAYDGEADFVVAHPELGILVIEVKGGRIGYDGESGRWSSIDRFGAKHVLSKDPVSQARQSHYTLYRKLRSTPSTRRFRYPVYHAVCFPDIVVNLDIKPDLPLDIVIDQRRLGELEASVRSIFRYWQADTAGSDPGDRGIAALVRLLAPVVELHSYLGAEFEAESQQIKELTQQQFLALNLLARERRAIVYGCAGSGKTFLALEKSARLADEGHSVLLTCFNTRLATWLNTTPYKQRGFLIRSFHQLCVEFARKAHVPIPPLHGDVVQGDIDDFFDSVLPQALLEATTRTGARFDALVVDEAQDFRDSWWIALEAVLSDPADGVLYIFCDDNQRIYAGAEKGYPFHSPAVSLDRNCRNTRLIHALVERYYQGPLTIHCQGPVGREPEIVPLASESDLVKVLGRRLHRLVTDEGVSPKDIVVLTPKSETRSQLKAGTRLGDCTLSWQHPTGSMGIECSTIHAYKGLEKPVVILAELNGLRGPDWDRLTYIGASRARNHLILLGELPPATR